MATVADTILIALGLKTDEFEKGLGKAKAQVESHAKAAAASLDQIGAKWKGVTGGIVRMIAAPVAGLLTTGSVIKSYFSGVAQVAQMTGAYSTKMEEWRKKRAMLARVNKEDIELYVKGREAITKFQITMADLSTAIMRRCAPAIRWLTDKLNTLSDWVGRNEGNIVRFLTVVAAVVTTALIPAFAKWAATILANPLTWLAMLLAGVAIAIDDLIVWLHGGEAAFGDFWEMLGSRQDYLSFFNKAIETGKQLLKEWGPALAGALAGFAAFKELQAVGGLISKVALGIRAIGAAALANPLTAILVILIGLFTYLYQHSQRFRDACSIAFESVAKFAGKFLDMLSGIFDRLKNTGVFERIGAIASRVFTLVGAVLENVIGKLGDFFEMLSNTGALDALGKVFSYVFQAMAGLAETVFAAIEAAWGVVYGLLTGDWSALGTAWDDLCTGLKDLFQPAIDVICALWQDFRSAAESVGQAVQDFFSGMCNSVRSAWDSACKALGSAWDAAVSKITALMNGIKAAFSSVTGAVKAIWDGLIKGLTDKWNAFLALFTGFKDFIKEKISGALKTVLDHLPDWMVKLLPGGGKDEEGGGETSPEVSADRASSLSAQQAARSGGGTNYYDQRRQTANLTTNNAAAAGAGTAALMDSPASFDNTDAIAAPVA